MKAARIHQFGPPSVITIDDLPRPTPGRGEVLVQVACAGVGPWDAWIREHKSVVVVSLPLTLGSDFSGIVAEVGPGVSRFAVGDPVYGVTNPQFVGAYAEYAIASENMIARKPEAIDFVAAASVPVVGVTAWQMLFDYAEVQLGQSVLILGGAGNVGSYAIQLANLAGLNVFATASSQDTKYVRELGAEVVIDTQAITLEDAVPVMDIVLDTVGGILRESSLTRLRPGGVLVSVVSAAKQRSGSHVRDISFSWM